MIFAQIVQIILFLSLTNLANAAYSANGKNVAVYWGQGTGEKDLGTYCSSGNIDIVLISFVNNFQGSSVSYNFGASCSSATCPTIAKGIKTCQSKGVKVILSMGGATGSYGISGSSDASEVADKMYELFGPSGSVFSGATIDGVDLDIEAGTTTGYTDFVTAIKKKFGSDFLVTAAPQCVFPDASIGETLKNANIDIAFIQFYNNPCALDKTFNWDTWTKAVSSYKNTNMKLYIGLPGSSSAAGSGYVDLSTVKSKASASLSASNFGGFMVWDAVRGTNNVVDGTSFIGGLKKILGGSSSTSGSGSSSSAKSSSPSSTAAAAAAASSLGHVHSKASTVIATAPAVTATTTKHVSSAAATVNTYATAAAGGAVVDNDSAANANSDTTVIQGTGSTSRTATIVAPSAASVASAAETAVLNHAAVSAGSTDVHWADSLLPSILTDVYWAVTSGAEAAAETSIPSLLTDVYWAVTSGATA